MIVLHRTYPAETAHASRLVDYYDRLNGTNTRLRLDADTFTRLGEPTSLAVVTYPEWLDHDADDRHDRPWNTGNNIAAHYDPRLGTDEETDETDDDDSLPMGGRVDAGARGLDASPEFGSVRVEELRELDAEARRQFESRFFGTETVTIEADDSAFVEQMDRATELIREATGIISDRLNESDVLAARVREAEASAAEFERSFGTLCRSLGLSAAGIAELRVAADRYRSAPVPDGPPISDAVLSVPMIPYVTNPRPAPAALLTPDAEDRIVAVISAAAHRIEADARQAIAMLAATLGA